MLRFLGSLKTRTAVATSLVIAAILLAQGFYLVVSKHSELRRDIDKKSRLFASLTCEPICLAYDNYYASGLSRFRILVREYLAQEPNVDRLRIISVKGRVLYDSTEDPDAPPRSEDESPPVQDAAVREAVLGLEPKGVRVRGADGREALEIVVPYVEERGRHRLNVTYRVDYSELRPKVTGLAWATGGLTLLSIVAAAFVAVAFTRHITQPIEELTRGAQSIAEGRFDQRLDIWSGDEIQLLAEAFNHMAARLKENVEQLERSNKKLAEVNEELKELDRLKSDLLANVSHELRTPLTAIKGYTDYMLERKLGTVTEKQE